MATVSVPARAGLVGHPSDGYGGATLAVTLHNFAASVQIEPAPELDIAPDGDAEWPEGGEPLIRAAVDRFCRHCEQRHARPYELRASIRYGSTIPRQVGLAGSSAIVIATLRALEQHSELAIDVDDLPALALSVETEGLGIAAGLQDRVVQTFGGLVFMDFAQHRYEPLDPELLPDLFIAWRPGAAGSSGTAHADVRARHARGDPQVTRAMAALASLAHDARHALQSHDHAGFARVLQAGYEIRASLFDLDPRHTAMVDAAHALGLPATYTGSGGAIVGIASDPEAVARLAQRLASQGVRVTGAQVGR